MRQFMVLFVFLTVGTLLGDEARAELKPAAKGASFRRTVGERLCYAGRFQFERWDRERDFGIGRFVAVMPSCPGHPNAVDPGEVRVVRLGNGEMQPEAGRTYCLILTAGSKQGMTIEAFGPDDAATVKELKEVIESPSAFENDATWKKRRQLWSRFRDDLGPAEMPLLYGEDDACRNILYVKRGDARSPLFLYNARKGKSEPVVFAKVLPGINRITYDNGYFRGWFNGSIECNVGVEDADSTSSDN